VRIAPGAEFPVEITVMTQPPEGGDARIIERLHLRDGAFSTE